MNKVMCKIVTSDVPAPGTPSGSQPALHAGHLAVPTASPSPAQGRCCCTASPRSSSRHTRAGAGPALRRDRAGSVGACRPRSAALRQPGSATPAVPVEPSASSCSCVCHPAPWRHPPDPLQAGICWATAKPRAVSGTWDLGSPTDCKINGVCQRLSPVTNRE